MTPHTTDTRNGRKGIITRDNEEYEVEYTEGGAGASVWLYAARGDLMDAFGGEVMFSDPVEVRDVDDPDQSFTFDQETVRQRCELGTVRIGGRVR